MPAAGRLRGGLGTGAGRLRLKLRAASRQSALQLPQFTAPQALRVPRLFETLLRPGPAGPCETPRTRGDLPGRARPPRMIDLATAMPGATPTAQAMNTKEAKRVLETALICATSPLPLADLKALFDDEVGADTLRRLLEELAEDWQGRGVELVTLSLIHI